MCSCGSVGRCLSLRRRTLGLTRGVWEGVRGEFVRMGWGSEARGTRQRQAAAAGSRWQAARGRRQAASDEACTGRGRYVRRSGEGSSRRSMYRTTSFWPSSNFTCVPSTQYITGMYYRGGVGARQNVTCGGRSTRSGADEACDEDDEDDEDEDAAQARCIALEERCLEHEQVVAVEKS